MSEGRPSPTIPSTSMVLGWYCPSLGHQIAPTTESWEGHVFRPPAELPLLHYWEHPTNFITVGYGNYWEPEVVAEGGENLPHLFTALLEHHFLLLDTSTESTTSISNDSNLQTVCLPSCPLEGATGAPNHQHQVQEHLFIPQLSPCLLNSAHQGPPHARARTRRSSWQLADFLSCWFWALNF